MDAYPKDLAARMPNLPVEELLRIVAVDQDQYRPEAVALAREELRRRGVPEASREQYETLRATTGSPPRRGSWLVPLIHDELSAKRAARQGVIAAVVVAATTALVAVLAMRGVHAVSAMDVDAFAFLDAALFAAVAFGVWRQSRVAALSGLVFYLGERLYAWSTQGRFPGGLALFLTFGFVNGVRGTLAFHKFRTNASDLTQQRIEPR